MTEHGGSAGPEGWRPNAQQPGSPASGPSGWSPQGGQPSGQPGWSQQGGPSGQGSYGPGGQPGQYGPGNQGGQYGHPGQGGQYGQPGQSGQWGQGAPGQYGQQPGQYGQPPSQGGQYGQPSTQQFPPQQFGGGTPPAEPRKGKGLVITAIVAVVALLIGGGVYWFALRDKGTGVQTAASGQASPQDAVNALFTSLGNSDPIGLADQLDPAEAKLFTDLNSDIISELKRLEVLSPQASADSMTGTKISVQGLTYDGTDEQITDSIRVVKLTGGTITVQSDPSQIPLSDKIKDAFGDEISQAQPKSETVDIAKEVAKRDGKPIRIATVNRNGQWYVSLFYSIADNAVQEAGLPNPTAADRIAPQGSASPEDAVNKLFDAAAKQDVATLIAVTAPDEMGALHDYGQIIVDQAGNELKNSGDVPFTVDDVKWTTSEVTGGTKVSLESITITAEGETVSLARDVANNAVTLTVPGQPAVTIDQSNLETYLAQATGGDVPPELVDLAKRELPQLLNLGIVTTQVDGQWYISPVRSFSDIFVSILKGMEPQDVDYLISLAKQGG